MMPSQIREPVTRSKYREQFLGQQAVGSAATLPSVAVSNMTNFGAMIDIRRTPGKYSEGAD